MEQTCQVQNLIASAMQTEAGLLAWRSQGGTHGEDTVQNLIRCSGVDGGQASPEKSRGNPWPERCVKVTRDNLPLTAGKGEVNNSRCPDSSMPRTRQASRMMARRNTRRYEEDTNVVEKKECVSSIQSRLKTATSKETRLGGKSVGRTAAKFIRLD